MSVWVPCDPIRQTKELVRSNRASPTQTASCFARQLSAYRPIPVLCSTASTPKRGGLRASDFYERARERSSERPFTRDFGWVAPWRRKVLQSTMPDFVDYNKRDVSLPSGCKDLADLLKPRAGAPDVDSFLKWFRSRERRRESVMGTLADLPRHVSVLFASRAMACNLSLSLSDDRLTASFQKLFLRDGTLSVTLVQERTSQEGALLEFLSSHGLRLPTNLVQPKLSPSMCPTCPLTECVRFHPCRPIRKRLLNWFWISFDIWASQMKRSLNFTSWRYWIPTLLYSLNNEEWRSRSLFSVTTDGPKSSRSVLENFINAVRLGGSSQTRSWEAGRRRFL
jgi:hypothetical protein